MNVIFRINRTPASSVVVVTCLLDLWQGQEVEIQKFKATLLFLTATTEQRRQKPKT